MRRIQLDKIVIRLPILRIQFRKIRCTAACYLVASAQSVQGCSLIRPNVCSVPPTLFVLAALYLLRSLAQGLRYDIELNPDRLRMGL